MYQRFRTASIVIEPNLFIDIIEEPEFRVQYREYLKKLKLLIKEKTEMKDLDSLSILTKLFEGTEFSLNIEAIMGILARACSSCSGRRKYGPVRSGSPQNVQV